MLDYYYQIKAQSIEHGRFSNWAFPPLFSGKVTAENKKAAKLLIEEEYGRKFPLRVLEKDLANEHYLLNIQEIKDDDERTKGLFELRECMQCGLNFRTIDLYNDHNEIYKGREYCGHRCRELHRLENIGDQGEGWGRKSRPMIYQITNLATGLSYIGKTTQVFTLRWYQHFYQGGSCKFHQAIKTSKAEDWEFRILETAVAPEGTDKNQYLLDRERYWIEKLDTIDNGYNSL
jgi:GIY-YIG catalytic domain